MNREFTMPHAYTEDQQAPRFIFGQNDPESA
jgi:hypothetical protein